MSFPTGGNTKNRGEWSVLLLAAVCALLLAAPAQSTPLVSPAAFTQESLSCANVLAWLQSGDETANAHERRAVLLQALCAAGALDRHEAETLLASLEAGQTAVTQDVSFALAAADFPPVFSPADAPLLIATRGAEYSLSRHEAAFLNGVRTNRILN